MIFGLTARHKIRTEREVPGPGAISEAQEIKRDGWYIDVNVPEGCPLRVTPFQGVAIEPAIAADSTKIDKIEIHYTGVEEVGFPIKVTTMSRIPAYTSKMEVTELSTAPLDPALFEVPAGFKQVQRFTERPPSPPSSKVIRVLDWVRQSVHKSISMFSRRVDT
jgi:hypothetical protein